MALMFIANPYSLTGEYNQPLLGRYQVSGPTKSAIASFKTQYYECIHISLNWKLKTNSFIKGQRIYISSYLKWNYKNITVSELCDFSFISPVTWSPVHFSLSCLEVTSESSRSQNIRKKEAHWESKVHMCSEQRIGMPKTGKEGTFDHNSNEDGSWNLEMMTHSIPKIYRRQRENIFFYELIIQLCRIWITL